MVTCESKGSMPTMTARPPRLAISKHCSAVFTRPMASKA